MLQTDRSKKPETCNGRRKFRSKLSIEKFPDQKALESMSQRHSMRLYESKILAKDPVLSSQLDRASSSLLREKDCDNKSLLNSFIIKKESIVYRERDARCTPEIIRNLQSDRIHPERAPQINSGETKTGETGRKSQEKRKNVVRLEPAIPDSPAKFGTETLEEKPNESAEVNIKISILNMNNNCLESAGKIELEATESRTSQADPEPKNEMVEWKGHQFDRFDLVEEFLVEDTLTDALFGSLVEALADANMCSRRRIPKLDIGSLEEKGVYDLKERAEREIESMANLEGSGQTVDLNQPSLAREDQQMLTMMKENSHFERVVTANERSGEEAEEVIYAIRTNIETIVEYSDLLIKIISEEFMSQVLATVNRFHADRERVNLLIEREHQKGGWDRGFLQKMGFEPEYIGQVCALLNQDKAARDQVTPRHDSKENCKNDQNHAQPKATISDKRSTKAGDTSSQSKVHMHTISNIDNFATLRSLSDAKGPGRRGANVWDFPVKPFCVLGKNVFLRLTDKILSSYAEANIQENLFDIQKIFHRSIFDSFNESLSEYIFRTKKYNIFLEEILILKKPQFDLEDLNFFLAKAKYILIEKASEMVGFLLNKEDSELGRTNQTTSRRT